MPQERDDLGLWMLERSLGLSAGGRWQFSLGKRSILSRIMQRAEKPVQHEFPVSGSSIQQGTLQTRNGLRQT
jgi:hypothetical protein